MTRKGKKTMTGATDRPAGSKIRAIIKRPDEEYGHVTWISPTLKNLQKTVGGFIEAVTIDNPVTVGQFVIICNEDGKLMGLPINFYLGEDDAICGDVAVLGIDGEEFGDCPLAFAEWKQILKEWGN